MSETFRRLRTCPSFDEVDRRIRKGYNLGEVAAWLQAEKGEYTHVQLDSLTRLLRRYRTHIEEEEKVEIVPLSEVIRVRRQEDESVDALGALTVAINRQLARVERFFELEENLGVPLPGLGSEIERLSRMAREYIQTGQSLGLEPRIPEQLLVAFGRVGSVSGKEGGDARHLLERATDPERVWQHLLALEKTLE